MIVTALDLQNFRNYESLHLSFHPGTNVFYGDNAQGKTNILEGLYLCGTSKSHKGSKDREMIRFGADEAHLRMLLEREEQSRQIDLHIRKGKTKGIAINQIPIHRAGELFGIVNFVFFSPEDLNLIKNGPAERRRFIDMELSQLDSVYLAKLTEYQKILNQRNRLLKDYRTYADASTLLDVLDLQLCAAGRAIISEREQFILQLSELLPDIHSRLSGHSEHIEVAYEKNITAEKMEEQLFLNRERDISSGTTLTGPHRDDMNLKVEGVDLRHYGSQGQQRTAALSLKLAEISLVRRKTKEQPILLLDDVLSELDRKRQHFLLENISQTQTFLTCTGVDEFVENEFHIDRSFHVVKGQVFS